MLGIFLSLSSSFAANYENLYIVGNACDAGWDPDKAIALTPGETPGTFTWTGNLVAPTTEQQRFKFLVARSWSMSLTCRLDVDGHLLIESGEIYDIFERAESSSSPDNAFQVPENGEYTITVDVNNMKMTCTKSGEIEEPSVDLNQLYLVGSACEAGWDPYNPIEMTKQSEGIFTWTGTLSTEDGNEFKFLNETGIWNKTINPLNGDVEVVLNTEYDLNFRPLESSPNDYKFKVTTTGNYTINVNLNTMKMTVSDATNAGIESINKFFLKNIKIYNNTVTVSVESNELIQTAGIFDMTGKCLNLISNIRNSVMLADKLANGIYIVKINSENKEYVQKIVIK